MPLSTLPVGIDLGTLYSCVGVWQQNRIEIISSKEGNKLFPSCVAFCSTGRLIGDAAKNKIDVEQPNQNTVIGVKSLIGRRFNDPKIFQNVNQKSFYVVNNNDGLKVQVYWKGEVKYFSPEEISAMVLTNVKRIAEGYTGSAIKDTVISAPAHFNSSQRKGIKDAATIAGLNLLRIISKPIAAALVHHFFQKNRKDQKTILIFDLGSETTEVSVVSINEGSHEIIAVAFDQSFGGRDFDNRLVKHLTNELKRKFKANVNSSSVYKLQSAAQQAKHTLSSSSEVEIKIDALADDVNLSAKLSRRKFEEVCSDLFIKILVPVKKALQEAKLAPSLVDNVVLIGGSTRIPKVKNILQKYFNNKSLDFPTDPEVTVAYGAAIFAAVLNRDMSISRHIQTESFSVVDVIPFSLSIGTAEGKVSKIISRNTKVPLQKVFSFTPDEFQSILTLKVFEGERADKTENDLLCILRITDIPPVSSGFPRINLTFSIDENGILEISAKENNFPNSTPLGLIIDGNRGLSKEEVNKMAAEEAERCREEDGGLELHHNLHKCSKRKLSE